MAATLTFFALGRAATLAFFVADGADATEAGALRLLMPLFPGPGPSSLPA
eukprot:CAMPEP_0183321074 /NCGR_PEP_ID=MMETSP0160_2-20130417/68002_1 /TAXON_ID=2839 ORGANISM="Odontella Sinensis, Strain Grunow 1884" /NCGR_SAMPLE_ID=MMETSP0160_2 /ASSEMBLY_ACC=CAM_ASM_000250 /LENGTH=49 /DNA_ID= /DNA_START= /DNA_END= /DNA_ORIENTATION=